jgi:Phosphatidylinositol-4-phosphate 5-Kinase
MKRHLALAGIYSLLVISSQVEFLASLAADFDSEPHLLLLILSPVGIFVLFFRVGSKEILREIKWKVFPGMKFKNNDHKKISTKVTLINFEEEASSFNEFFEVNSIKVLFMQNLIKILCSLSLRFYADGLEFETYKSHSNFYFTEAQFFQILNGIVVKDLEKCKFYIVYDPNLLLVEHMPRVFEKIREVGAVLSRDSLVEKSFLTNENIFKLKGLKNLQGGRSDAFLFNTSDQKFVIKILSHDDKKSFLKILPGYYDRIVNQSQSKLVKIFGLFTLKPENINFIVMENLIPDRKNCVVFDIKGSIVNRKTEISRFPDTESVLKDLNFIESQINIKFETKDIFYSLIEDFGFLNKFNIIDYSLILGIPCQSLETTDRVIPGSYLNIGIIDIFQNYNLKKLSEKSLKSLLYKPDEISVTNPKQYHDRIIDFCVNSIFKN